jgi:hypothetical protein
MVLGDTTSVRKDFVPAGEWDVIAAGRGRRDTLLQPAQTRVPMNVRASSPAGGGNERKQTVRALVAKVALGSTMFLCDLQSARRNLSF